MDIKKFKANFIFKFEIDMNLPSEMHLDITNYNFEGWLGLIKIFGDGKLRFVFIEKKVELLLIITNN